MVSPRLKNSTEGETKPATYEHIGHLHGCQIRAVASATGTLWYMGVGKHAPSHHWCAKAKRELLLQVSIMHDGETGYKANQERSTVPTQVHQGEPGQHFHMDFGFVSSNEYQMRTEEGRNVTSIDGKRAYLLVVDRTTRYMWTHVTDTKEPPIEATRMILSKFKSNNPHRTVRTDQDSALSRSSEFRKMIETEGFIIEETGTDNSQQNSRAERPHRDLAQMTRCMLHSAGLGPEYWTYALVYATYLKNRIPHKGINKTPFEALTGAKPDLSGCRISMKRQDE
jgi:hypothetical protein